MLQICKICGTELRPGKWDYCPSCQAFYLVDEFLTLWMITHDSKGNIEIERSPIPYPKEGK